jgi:K+-sensing histidine kinase KdpD
VLTTRACKARQAGFAEQTRRWWSARRRKAGRVRLADVPIVMIAVDTTHPDDDRHPAIRRVTRQILATSAEFRLVCVSVVKSAVMNDGSAQLNHLIRLHHWVEPFKLPPERLSLHVIEAPDPADALLKFARANNVDLIVVGAPTPGQGKSWWRSVASTVTANAHCSVHVVRLTGATRSSSAADARNPLSQP